MTDVARERAGPSLAPRLQRTPAQALFWRLVLINGAVFTIGIAALTLSPATVSSPVLVTELPVLVIGLAVILGANTYLLRRSLAPLVALTRLMERVQLLHPSDRLHNRGNGDLTNVIDTFNAMLDRLEAEHSASSAHALAAQEAERHRIAQELHDEIGQTLTVALLGLKRAVDNAPEDLREELHSVQETVRASLDEVRQVARRLRPGVLEDLGLASALNALATEFSEASGVPVTRTIDPNLPNFGADTELVLYRVAQEGLTNIARHARASHAELSLMVDDDEVILRISDNGRGAEITEGAGIRGMRERANLIGARLSIRSRPGRGTDVRLVAPVTMTEHER